MRLADYFDSAVSRHTDRVAFVDGASRVNFADAQTFVHAVARALTRDSAIPPDAHVAIYSPNDYRVSLLQIAINRADMAWVSVHTRNSTETNLAVLKFADCDLVFFHSVYEPIIPTLREGLPESCRFVCIDRESPFGLSLDRWTAETRTRITPPPEDPLRPAMFQPTGGTTGPSKGAIHCNRSLEMGLINVFTTLDINHDSRVLAVAPLTHAACMVTLAAAVRGGCTVVLPAFDVKTVLRTIAEERITHLFLPPTIVYSLLSEPALSDTDLSSLRCLAIGAAPMAPEKAREAVRRIGPVLYEVYGQSECGFPMVAKRPEDYLLPDGTFDDIALRSAG